MYQLDAPFFFYGLGILPILWIAYFLIVRWKRRAQNRFAHSVLMEKLSPNRSNFKPALKLFMFSLGISFLTLGLVNPKIGTQLETVKREGVDIVFAIDVSKSMLAEDIAPNRLEKSKRLVSALLISWPVTELASLPMQLKRFPSCP